MKSVEIELGTATFKLETGRMAKQANGSVLVTYGDTVVLVAATSIMSRRNPNIWWWL